MGRINRVATQIHSADARRLVAGTIIPSFCNVKDTSDTTRNSFAPALGNPFTPHRTAFITPPKALCKSVVAKLLFYLIGFFQNITLFFGCQEFFAKKSKNFSNASFGLKTRKTVQTVCMKKISTVLLCLLLLAPLHFSQISRHSFAESAARPASEISRCAADEAVKEIFLTFDDGPTDSVTPKVLDILAEEKVKATFFVTGRQIKGREKIIERIANEGHILGIHTFTHEYAKIYASSSSLLRDIEKCRHEITRVLPDYRGKLYRFPGGSFMHPEYREAVGRAGYRYYDWNAMTGDAEGAYTSKQLLENAIRSSKGKSRVVLLMHDGITKSKTAEALPAAIKHFKEENFTFSVL